MSEDDATSRGVLYPQKLPTFARIPATGDVAALVRWFWIPEWSLPPGQASRQLLIGFPACNLVVEPTMTGISGPTTRVSYRELRGSGWAVGALLRPAAVPALVHDPAAIRDGYRGVHLPGLHSTVAAAMTSDAPAHDRRIGAVDAFNRWIRSRIPAPSAEALLANRVVEVAESDARLVTVTDLASEVSVSPRSLQRLAAKYIGLSPVALIRRRRLQEAADQLRQDPTADLTALAHRFGYADHAHLTNDFRRTLGFTPSDYRRGLSVGGAGGETS